MPEMPPSGAPAVNPFATTAPPGSLGNNRPPSSDALKAISANAKAPPVSIEAKQTDSNPPPVSPRAVSPLAVSSGVSGRTPFSEAVEKARQSAGPVPSKVKKIAGTQLMDNAPKRPEPPTKPSQDAAPPEEVIKKRAVPRTVAMAPPPKVAPAPQSVLAPSSGGGAPQSVLAPGSVLAPSSHGQAPNSYIAAPGSVLAPGSGVVSSGHGAAPGSTPPGSLGQQFQPPPQPPPPPQSSYARPMQPLAPYQQPAPAAYPPPQWGAPPPGYGFQYVPGARVQVTWSNGQRYPATVSQVNGPQCLVVFPDGQQHWVQLQYLSPG